LNRTILQSPATEKKGSFVKDVKVRNKISDTIYSLEFYEEGVVSSPSCW